MQPGHEISPPRTPLKPRLYKEALLNFRAAILLDHPVEQLSMEDVNLVLAKVGEVCRKTLDGGTHYSDPIDWTKAQSSMHVLIKGL